MQHLTYLISKFNRLDCMIREIDGNKSHFVPLYCVCNLNIICIIMYNKEYLLPKFILVGEH